MSNRQHEFITNLESATADEFARMLRSASQQESGWLAEHFGETQLAELRALAEPSRSKAQGNVVVLHGILGSHLALTGDDGRNSTIWISPWSLVKGEFEKLWLNGNGRSRHPVSPTGTLKRYYGKWLLHLSRRWNVRAFAYDWRLSVRESADQLARSIDAWFGAAGPVHLVAHSMGGLVARAYAKAHAARWSQGGRLVMLGTPNRGSYAIPQLFAGYHSLLSVLALVDLFHNKDELRRIIASFEGASEMLPFGEDELFERGRYGAGAPHEALLGRVRRTQQWLSDAIDPARMSYVAGSGRPTVAGVKDANQLDSHAGYRWNRWGDGTVPHSLGLLEGVPTYFADEEHGKLPGNSEVLAAIDEILESGRCAGLATEATDLRGEHADEIDGEGMEDAKRYDIDPKSNPVDALMAAFAGVSEGAPQISRTKIRVEQGILEQASEGTVAVAYYAGARPRYFGSRPVLAELVSRGVVSGELGAPFFVPGEPPVLLLGMGPVGRFGAPELAVYVRQLCWTAVRLGVRSLTTALTGSGRGNLSLRQAAEIWCKGIAESQLESVTFVEAEAGRAREMAGVLGVEVKTGHPRMRLEGKECGPETQQYASRLSIEATGRGVRVAMLTGEASVPEREIPLDLTLAADINDRLARAREDAERREWAECLLKLLLPAELKQAFEGAAPMVVACDRETAGLHWEMLRAGSVSRQLKTGRAPFMGIAQAGGRALLVADTCEEDPLPGARQEAEGLAALLVKKGLEVTALIGPERATRAAVLRELLLRRYDVMHFAGHCRYAVNGGQGSGWRFSGDTVLGANELSRVDRIPPFVFSNACESGRMPPSAGDAVSFAESFFARGVQNLICTAWPVDDGEAAAFAAAVYERASEPMHVALTDARRLAGARAGAWQHYGNPFFRIQEGS